MGNERKQDMNDSTTYSYDHLVKKHFLEKNHKKILFDFYQKLFICCGDMDEYVEKHYDRSARTLLNLITDLSDSIKGELWRELERQGLDIIYEKEELAIERDREGNIIS
jgi:hypothetical protein